MLVRNWKKLATATGLITGSAAVYMLSDGRRVGLSGTSSGLDPKSFNSLKLNYVVPYNHNTAYYVFALANPNAKLDLPVASYVLAKAVIDGKEIIRPYTPVDAHERGVINLLIKSYPKGLLSKHVKTLNSGDTLDFKGPMPKFEYKPNSKKQIGMIAGGSGITPMLQMTEKILDNPNDKTEVTLVFANVADEDILLRERFDELARYHKKSGKFKVHYVLEKPPSNWSGSTGYVTPDIIKQYLPPPSDSNLILVCGPPPMMAAISGNKAPDYSQGKLEGHLARLCYNSSQVFKY